MTQNITPLLGLARGRTWHQLRLLLVPVQGGKGAHPRQRRAEPVLPAWDEITALVQDSHPYHVGRLVPLPRRGRIDRRAAARTECLQALPLSAVVLRYVAGWPVMRKVAPGTGTLTRKAEPVPTWQSVQWQTVVFSGSASPSTLM